MRGLISSSLREHNLILRFEAPFAFLSTSRLGTRPYSNLVINDRFGMFNFAKKASLKIAAKNILETTALLAKSLSAYEKAFYEAIAAGNAEKGGEILIASTQDSNVRACAKRFQLSLICGIPLKDITNDLLKPFLTAVYPAELSTNVIKKALNEILFNHFHKGGNTPMTNHHVLWNEVMVEIKKWAGDNWSSEGINDPRFNDLFPL